MTTRPAQATTNPATVPTLQDRAGPLAALGWTGREAEWIALVALHSGVFTRSQCGAYFEAGADRKRIARFVHALIDQQLAIEDARAIFPGGARAVHITQKAIYRALGIENVKHRRGKHAATPVLMRRLLSLDYLIERPTLGWLPTEDDKVQRFEALGIDRGTLPSRNYGPPGTPQVPRYFDLKFPLAVDAPPTTFVYVDAGHATDSELRSWGAAHAPLWAALRARTFAVHVVAIGTGVLAAQRAAPVLKSWTRDGDGQGAPDLDTPTKADPDIRQELARLDEAIRGGHRQWLREAGGWEQASDRYLYLSQLPEGTPTRTTARVAIDRFSTWSTIRFQSRGSDVIMCRPLDRSWVLAGVLAGVLEHATPTEGGGVAQTAGGVWHSPRPCFAVGVRDVRRRASDPNRASGEEDDGSDPPFLAAGAARLSSGGVWHAVWHPAWHTPRRRWGGSLPSVCIPAGRLPGPHAGRTMSRDERRHA